MIKKLAMVILVVLSGGFSIANANNFQGQTFVQKRNNDYNGDYRRKHNYPKTQDELDAEQKYADAQGDPSGDKQIVAAVERRRRVDFIQGSGMVVVKFLPDDNSGLRHQ